MKRVALLSLVAALGAAGAVAEGLNPPRQPEAAETAALRDQVAELQRRLAALEARVEEINQPRLHKAAMADETPMQWDRLDPAAIGKAAKLRGVQSPTFPAERR